MKNCLRYIMTLVILAMCSLHSFAADTAQRDTVYFYDSWEQMLYMQPSAMLIDPFIVPVTPYEVEIFVGDDDIDEMIIKEHIAVSLGDSTWLMSSVYLNKEFKGNAYHLSGFVPVYFNEKVAFITYYGKLSVKDILFGLSVGESGDENYNIDYYYIDFSNRRLERVNSSYLSQLLEDYHDLQMRYEGMKDYKKRYIIDDYFFKFIDRASEDFMRPYILDLVN